MLAVARKPRTKNTTFKIIGKIDNETLKYLNTRFGKENVDVDDEIIDVMESGWYKNMSKKVSPGDRVRIYRKNYNLTQEELAKKVGISGGAYISRIETGYKTVSKTLAKKFSVLFGVDIEMFLTQ